jgi:hypothetical protein
MTNRIVLTAALAAVLVLTGGCRGTKTSSPATAPTTTTAAASTTGTGGAATTGSPGALQAEANAAAAGDIPDNQVFLTFANRPAAYSIKYPEGWARRGGGTAVTFRDKNNIVRVVVAVGRAPTQASARADVARLGGARVEKPLRRVAVAGRPAFAVTYTTKSAPNPVTGKRVTLVVDRYYLWGNGRTAIVDLGTPVGVDNVDAYRLMIDSFRWR